MRGRVGGEAVRYHMDNGHVSSPGVDPDGHRDWGILTVLWAIMVRNKERGLAMNDAALLKARSDADLVVQGLWMVARGDDRDPLDIAAMNLKFAQLIFDWTAKHRIKA